MNVKEQDTVLNVASEDARLLCDIGFIALSRGRLDAARTIFLGLDAARPGTEAPQIGLALIDLLAKKPALALQRLRGLPPEDATRLFIGLSLQEHGEHSEAKEILDELLATASEPAFAGLARHLTT